MPIDPNGEPWSGATYRGFAGGRSSDSPDAPPPPSRRAPSRILMAGGVAGALALGVGFGLLMRPELIGSEPATSAPPAAAPAQATPGAAQVPIAVSPPAAPEPIPRAPGKLQTLPPEMAAAAQAQAHTQVVTVDPPPPAEAEAPRIEPAAPQVAEPAPPAQYHASFDCGTARPGAEEMVCADAALAAADRRLARAYRRAMASGIEPADLRQEQLDWVAIREDAARHSQRALANVYDQRIRELNEIAESAPEPME